LVRREPRGDKMLPKFRKLNQCAGCHLHDKPEKAAGEKSFLPNRMSDAMGFYAVQTVLEATSPIERSRPNDLNLDDPFIQFTCDSGAPERVGEGGKKTLKCDDLSVPHGTLD